MANPNAREDGKKGGRPKGSANKLPRDLKEKVLAVAEQLEAEGKSLTDCAIADPPWFYANFLKPMLPKDVKIEADIRHTMTDEQLKSRLADLLGKVGAAATAGGTGEKAETE